MLQKRVVAVSTTDALVIPEIQADSAERGGATLLRLLPASVFAFVWPPASGVWRKATLFRACMVGLINTACAFVWMYLVGVAGQVWMMRAEIGKGAAARWVPGDQWHWKTFADGAGLLRARWIEQWQNVGMVDRISLGGTMLAGIALAYAVPFFMLLPFAARPGRNKACMQFVLKTVLQGSGVVHWWGAAYFLVFISYAARRVPQIFDNGTYAQAMSPLLLVFSGLVLWHMGVLIHAARREYRKAGDFPKEHDPWCDVCGYNLTGIDPAGRCPECGKPIQESLAPEVRPPTGWERRPSIFNGAVIGRQIAALVRHPRRLFYSMPTMSGQRAAQRWLMLSLGVLFLAAAPIVPAIYWLQESPWNSVAITGTLAMCLAWAGFGLMMVGIETGGIATFSRLRGHPGGGVYLAAAAKVTCYTSILMVTWVILGGLQLVAYVFYEKPLQDYFQAHHMNAYRWVQIVLGVSLAIAHVGGLLWYELTVYRGVRAIQYASK